jgi:hypothetical protein
MIEPAGRYDTVFDLSKYEGLRIISINLGDEVHFSSAFYVNATTTINSTSRLTDNIIPIDVIVPFNGSIPDDIAPSST